MKPTGELKIHNTHSYPEPVVDCLVWDCGSRWGGGGILVSITRAKQRTPTMLEWLQLGAQGNACDIADIATR